MAYNKQKLYKQAQEVISKNTLFWIEDVVAFLPCVKNTFYDLFPIESYEMDTLKGMLEDNKIKVKTSIRGKLHKSDKAGELLALYRMICTPEERQNLNQSYIDHTTKGKAINELNELSDTELNDKLKTILNKLDSSK